MTDRLPPHASLQQDVKFVPVLCPHYGWDTDCARDSYLLACKNCNSFWRPRQEGLRKLGVLYLGGDSDEALYLPFWRVRADISRIRLDTYADFIKIANLTKFVKEDEAQTKFYFWIPAFKIGSHRFLQIANHVTLCQPKGKLERSMPEAQVYPVTLPMPEALKSLKTVLADFIRLPEINHPKLPGMVVEPKAGAVIYFPFHASGSEFIHPEYKVRVTRATLEHFRMQ